MFLSRLSRELQGRGSCLPAGCMLWAQSEAEQGSSGWPEGGGRLVAGGLGHTLPSTGGLEGWQATGGLAPGWSFLDMVQL